MINCRERHRRNPVFSVRVWRPIWRPKKQLFSATRVENLQSGHERLLLENLMPIRHHSPGKKRRPSIPPLYFLSISPLPMKWLAALVKCANPESNYMEGVRSIWVRLRAHLPRNKDSVTGELWASRSQSSLATNERGILSSVTSHCCEAAAPLASKVTCKTGGVAENAKT